MTLSQRWPRPLRICAVYLPLLTTIFAWFWLESDGGRVDASPFRDALYVMYFLVLPVGISAFLIHLLATLGTPRTLKWRLSISVAAGCLGVFLLHVMIKTSSDGEAVMAYLAIVIAFCLFSVAGFVVSTLAFYVCHIIRKNQSSQQGADGEARKPFDQF